MTASSNLARETGASGAPDRRTELGAARRDNGAPSLYEQAQELFLLRDFHAAAVALERLLGLRSGGESEYLHGTTAALLLLARSYYHSAQLSRAEATARQVLIEDPMDAYAALLLGRSLQRQGRRHEAEPVLRLARALGAPDLDD